MRDGTDEERNLRALIRKLALLNSISHAGFPNAGAIIGRIMAERRDLRGSSQRIGALTKEIVEELVILSPEEQTGLLRREFPDALEEELRRKNEISMRDSRKMASLPPLPEAVVGEVVTRFPPEPNGFMHIGHAKAAIFGREYANQYNGKFIVRFDDTNPVAEKKEFYGAFLEALSWLSIRPDAIRNASDDMEKFYELGTKLVKEAKAYACTCAQDEMRKLRAEGKPCIHRSQSVETNLKFWTEMRGSKMEKSSVVLRYSGDMSSSNTTMRDPVLFRIIDEPHPLQGKKYRVWPTYDFDGPVEDSLDGVSHAMRSKEYELRDELYYSILESLQLRRPKVVEFSRLALKGTTVSKRSLRKLIQEGKVEGWDDPRLPTIWGLRRRGFLPQAIKEFILSMGLSKVESEPTWDLLESINRKLLDPVTKRYFFVKDPVLIEVKGAPKNLELVLKFHPEKDFGSRRIRTEGEFYVSREDIDKIGMGKNFRLIEAYNAKLTGKDRDYYECQYLGEEKLEGIPKIQWVSATESITYILKVPGPLLLSNGDFNQDSLRTVLGRSEIGLQEIEPGNIVQFIRVGFSRIDQKGVAILAHK